MTACFVLYVVEPQSCGVGGDGFMFVHTGARGRRLALDGSGALPLELTQDRLRDAGHEVVPARGGASVTTPGAVALLETALAGHGTISLADAVAPARRLRERLASRCAPPSRPPRSAAASPSHRIRCSARSTCPEGRRWPRGRQFATRGWRNAWTPSRRRGGRAVLGGPIGAAIAERVRADGGFLSEIDLARHRDP